MLRFFAFAYRDLAKDARQLQALSTNATLWHDRIMSTYVQKRYTWETQKNGGALPFTLKEMYSILGEVTMDLLSAFRNDVVEREWFEEVLGERTSSFLSMGCQLNILIPVDAVTYRFAHRLVFNHFAVPYLIQATIEATAFSKTAIIPILGRVDDTRAIEALVRLQAEADHDHYGAKAIGQLAAEVLQRIGAPAVDQLLAGLGSENVRVRAYSAWALAGQVGAVEPLSAVLRIETNEWVKRNVVWALGEIRNEQAVEVLCDALADEINDVRGHAAFALGKIRDPRAIPFLAKCLSQRGVCQIGHSMKFIGEAAQEDLESIGTPEALATVER